MTSFRKSLTEPIIAADGSALNMHEVEERLARLEFERLQAEAQAEAQADTLLEVAQAAGVVAMEGEGGGGGAAAVAAAVAAAGAAVAAAAAGGGGGGGGGGQ
jgi:hypothetical protein